MAAGKQYWIWVFGSIEALRWVLKTKRMAFSDSQARVAKRTQKGDQVVLYVTRGAFNNPTRDRARLAGLVEVASTARKGKVLTLPGARKAERSYSLFVPFRPIALLPERSGPEVQPLVGKLERINKPQVWGHYFRQSPIEISEHDFGVLRDAVIAWRGVKNQKLEG